MMFNDITPYKFKVGDKVRVNNLYLDQTDPVDVEVIASFGYIGKVIAIERPGSPYPYQVLIDTNNTMPHLFIEDEIDLALPETLPNLEEYE